MLRRAFLQLSAGAGIGLLLPQALAQSQPAAGQVAPPPSGPQVPLEANIAWREAGVGFTDWRLRALSYALLAPNPHNLQAWLANLTVPDEVSISYDPTRALPMTDPFGRQLLIGCGCFAELFSIAASMDGIGLEAIAFPQGEPSVDVLDARPLIVFRKTTKTVAKDPLADFITARRSTKTPFDMQRAIDAGPLTDLNKQLAPTAPRQLQLGWVTAQSNAAQLQSLQSLIWRAWMIEANTHRTHKESVDYMRIGSAEVIANRDGISLGAPMFDHMLKAGQISKAVMLDPTSQANAFGKRQYEAIMRATPGMLWLSTADNARSAQFACGRAYMRVALAVTQAGLAMHPVSQCLQEFAEMAEPFKEAHDLLAKVGDSQPQRRVQMLCRIGYGPTTEPQPRRMLQALIRT